MVQSHENFEVALSNDPSQIRALALLAKDFRSTNLAKAQEIAETCLRLIGESALYPHEKALALTTLGICNRFNGNPQKALEQFSEAQSLYLSLNDLFNVADSYLKLGSVYRYLTDYQNALQCYEKGLAMFRQLNDANGTAIWATSFTLSLITPARLNAIKKASRSTFHLATIRALPQPLPISP